MVSGLSGYSVVRATESDRAALMAIQKICFCAGEEQIEYEHASWWIARQGEDEAGFICLQQSAYWSDCFYLARVGVVEDHQGHGLMQKLVRAAIGWAKKKGYAYIVTDVLTWNAASANGLINCGFRLFDPEEKWSGSRDVIYLSRDLSGR